MLNEEHTPNWVWWYFSFDDNAGLTEMKKEQIKKSHKVGTADYRHYILGLRGKAEGVIFDNFDKNVHCISYKQSLELIKDKRNQKQKISHQLLSYTISDAVCFYLILFRPFFLCRL